MTIAKQSNHFVGDDYKNKSHHQQSFNNKNINHLIDRIEEWSSDDPNAQIMILDLCCGHGKPTHQLLTGLESEGINVTKIIGTDISKSQIDTANRDFSHPKLEFIIDDAENINLQHSSLEHKFDVAVSLFGFHWIRDLNHLALDIKKLLKPQGHLSFFVPIEKMDLYSYREQLMTKDKWKQMFDNVSIFPFHASPDEYTKVFDQYFHRENSEYKIVVKSYSKDEIIDFFASWMLEVRFLNELSVTNNITQRNNLSQEYLSELIEYFPLIDTKGKSHKSVTSQLLSKEFDDQYVFKDNQEPAAYWIKEPCFLYEGQIKEVDAINHYNATDWSSYVMVLVGVIIIVACIFRIKKNR